MILIYLTLTTLMVFSILFLCKEPKVKESFNSQKNIVELWKNIDKLNSDSNALMIKIDKTRNNVYNLNKKIETFRMKKKIAKPVLENPP